MRNTNKFILIITAILLSVGTIIFLTSPSPPTPDQLVGTWISDEELEHKLVFSTTVCQVYFGNEVVSQYLYTIVNETCENYSENDTYYLRWVDNDDNSVYCMEITNFENNSLAIMNVDQGDVMLFIRN